MASLFKVQRIWDLATKIYNSIQPDSAIDLSGSVFTHTKKEESDCMCSKHSCICIFTWYSSPPRSPQLRQTSYWFHGGVVATGCPVALTSQDHDKKPYQSIITTQPKHCGGVRKLLGSMAERPSGTERRVNTGKTSCRRSLSQYWSEARLHTDFHLWYWDTKPCLGAGTTVEGLNESSEAILISVTSPWMTMVEPHPRPRRTTSSMVTNGISFVLKNVRSKTHWEQSVQGATLGQLALFPWYERGWLTESTNSVGDQQNLRERLLVGWMDVSRSSIYCAVLIMAGESLK